MCVCVFECVHAHTARQMLGGGRGSWTRSLLLRVLRAGSVPSHIAFIMDGNRRFARKMSLASAHGHALGFERLEQVRAPAGGATEAVA